MAPITLPTIPVWQRHPRVGAEPKAKPKRRSLWSETLTVLAPGLMPDQAEKWLRYFCNIICFRQRDAIVTRVGQGPRSWTAKPGALTLRDVARHLLGDAIAHLEPIWVGARSIGTSYFFCLDVDCDRGAHVPNSGHAPQLSSPPNFHARVEQVFQALRRLGIDPSDSRQVLALPTPSGGRHFYVFFDRPYDLDQYRSLLSTAGLKFAKGQIEFFPSTKQGLRLPFGFIPGETHDPTAWLRFTRDYSRGRVKRFQLEQLWETLERSLLTKPTPPSIQKPHHPVGADKTPLNQSPATRITPRPLTAEQTTTSHVGQFVKPKSIQDIERLLADGITVPGSRNSILLALAEHFIFIRGQTAAVTAEFLIRWAMNSRHESKDIHSDLLRGTDVVAKEINRMCTWCAAKREPRAKRRTAVSSTQLVFTSDEIIQLKEAVQCAPETERALLADFLLSFLAFAKRHGTASPDSCAWHAAPAVKQVIRKWPGCHHMHYKARIELATELGILRLHRGHWQNPNGPGRARTYGLLVKVSRQTATLTLEAARSQLIAPPLDAPRVETAEKSSTATSTSLQKEENDAHIQRPEKSKACCRRGLLTPAVHQVGSRGRLATCPRQRQPQQDAPERLCSRCFRTLRAGANSKRASRPGCLTGAFVQRYIRARRKRGPPHPPEHQGITSGPSQIPRYSASND